MGGYRILGGNEDVKEEVGSVRKLMDKTLKERIGSEPDTEDKTNKSHRKSSNQKEGEENGTNEADSEDNVDERDSGKYGKEKTEDVNDISHVFKNDAGQSEETSPKHRANKGYRTGKLNSADEGSLEDFTTVSPDEEEDLTFTESKNYF